MKPPIILFGHFSVIYDGRAASKLEAGQYLLIYKEDKSVSIHGADLITPRNYMSPGSELSIDHEGSKQIFTFTRKKEKIVCHIDNIVSRFHPGSWSKSKTEMRKTEKELCDKLEKNTEEYFGFIPTAIDREFKTKHGPVDLLLSTDDPDYTVGCVEVKRKKATINHCYQLLKYSEAISESGAEVISYLAAPEISKNAQEFCDDNGIIFVEVAFDVLQ